MSIWRSYLPQSLIEPNFRLTEFKAKIYGEESAMDVITFVVGTALHHMFNTHAQKLADLQNYLEKNCFWSHNIEANQFSVKPIMSLYLIGLAVKSDDLYGVPICLSKIVKLTILRVKLSIWLLISTIFDSNVLQLIRIPGRILVPPVTQFFRSKWLSFFFQCRNC